MEDAFDKLIEYFIETDQLGDYNKTKRSITLYDQKNDVTTKAKIRERYRLYVNHLQ